MNRTYIYVATDGNYGDANDMILVETTNFTQDDWVELHNAPDHRRLQEAVRLREAHIEAPTPMSDDEIIAAAITIFPDAELGEDNEGQRIIYTGIYRACVTCDKPLTNTAKPWCSHYCEDNA